MGTQSKIELKRSFAFCQSVKSTTILDIVSAGRPLRNLMLYEKTSLIKPSRTKTNRLRYSQVNIKFEALELLGKEKTTVTTLFPLTSNLDLLTSSKSLTGREFNPLDTKFTKLIFRKCAKDTSEVVLQPADPLQRWKGLMRYFDILKEVRTGLIND